MSEPTVPANVQRQRDPITFESVPCDEQQLAVMAELRAAFYGVTTILARLPQSRYKSIAETNLEQASMWANKAVSHGPKAEGG